MMPRFMCDIRKISNKFSPLYRIDSIAGDMQMYDPLLMTSYSAIRGRPKDDGCC